MKTIGNVYRQYHYLLDPHGAVGYLSLERYLRDHPGEKGFFLETAHPVKFPDPVRESTGKTVSIPGSVQSILHKPKQSILMKAALQPLKDYLLQRR